MAGGPSEIGLTDFSGGIKEDDNISASDVTARQWATLDGFVLEDEVSIRSQWPLQKVTTSTTMRALFPLIASAGSYLLGLDAAGAIWWTAAPADAAANATTRALTWTRLTLADGSPAPADTDYRFLTAQPYIGDSGGHVTAVRIHHCGTGSASPCVLAYEKTTGPGLVAATFTDYYPATTAGPADNPNPIPVAGKYPRANVATMWGDTLVLGDIEWFASAPDVTVTAGITMAGKPLKRYRNRMWFSIGGLYDTFNVNSVTGDELGPESVIVGLVPCSAGLLVFTTTATGRDGVVLFRGAPDSFSVEVLRGIGAPRRPTSDLGHRPFATEWAAAGSTAWIDHLSNVWHTDGSTVVQLDRVGPKRPSSPSVADHVASLGAYLVASRGGRLLCMRMFDDTGSWTTLALPGGVTVRAMAVLDNSIYFTATNGTCWRFTLADLAVSERGLADGQPLTLALASGTQDAQAPGFYKLWTRYGLKAAGVSPTDNPAVLKTFTLKAGPAGSSAPASVAALNRVLGARATVVLRGIGPAVEASVSATFTGDVRIESVSLWAVGSREATS